MHLKSRNDCSFMPKGKHKLQNYISHVQLAKFWSMKNLRKKRVRCFSLLCMCRVKRNEKWEGRQAERMVRFLQKSKCYCLWDMINQYMTEVRSITLVNIWFYYYVLPYRNSYQKIIRITELCVEFMDSTGR